MASQQRKLRALAAILRGERAVTAATRKAIQALLDEAARALRAAGYSPDVLDSRNPTWGKALTVEVLPVIEDLFLSSFADASRGVVDPSVYATRHLESVWNRLVGASDEVYDPIRLALAEGRAAEESIPQMAARVEALLGDADRWTNRATTIARTEVLSANNMGSRDAARATSAVLGEDPDAVIKEWVATLDNRTRETHADADGQQVIGLDAAFDVGGSSLEVPGDPSGDPAETINCRCVAIYIYPGDPEYAAAAEGTPYNGRTLASEGRGPAPDAVVSAQAESQMRAEAAESASAEAARAREAAQDDAQRAAAVRAEREAARAQREADSAARRAAAVERQAAQDARTQRASTTPVETPRASTPEPVVDRGPQTDMDRMARSLTVPELQAEARRTRGSKDAKAAARAELRRRGVTAALATGGLITNPRPMIEDGTPALVIPHKIAASLTAAQEAVMADQDDAQTGVVVVALPAASDPVHGIGPEQKHATLLYFGDVPGTDDDANPLLTPEFRTLLSSIVAETAGAQGPDTSEVTGVESLGDDGARVWMLAPGGLTALRDRLITEDVQVALNGVEQYPTYTPHVTIDYLPETEGTPEDPDPADSVSDEEAAVESITFDRLAVWWAGEQTEWPLTGGTEQEDPMPDQTTDVEAALHVVRQAGYSVGLTAAEGDVPAVPVPDDAVVPEAASDIDPEAGQPFYGIIWPEDVQSGDGRGIAAGATTNRDLPLPIMAQDAQMPGHDGAVRVGRIDTLTRDETTYTVPVMRYTGVWDTSPAALETARQVDNQIVRGISVDGDAVTVELRDSTGAVLNPMTDDFPEDGVVVEVATAARVSGGTVCSIPAFHQAYIANGRLEDRTDPEPGWNEDGTPKDNTLSGNSTPQGVEVEETEAAVMPLVASAGVEARRAPVWSITAGASVLPVVEARYFTNPGLDGEQWTTAYPEGVPLTVDDDGRVYGHLAKWGTCHIGIDGYCQEPPISASNYAYYSKGVVLSDAGERVRVGPLTMGTGHAGMHLGYRAAVEHYDNTGSVVADIAIGQDGVGIWFSGRIRPDATPEQVYALAAAGAVSGDWREVVRNSGDLELVAALVVNTPGFAMPRPAVAASAAGGLALVAAGMIQPREEVPVETTDRMVAAVVAALDRRDRARQVQDRINARLTEGRVP